MERRDFVANLGITLALACTAGLAACGGGGSDNPNPNPAPPGGGNARLSVNLNNELMAVGDAKISGGVILIRTGSGNTSADFAALSSICTHQGCTVSAYNKTSGLIECNAPCGHGSRYATSGAVNTGPAANPLTRYTVTVSGNILTVS
ncbi:cytochrome b6-f complex iron-sulfur subunit [Chitinophaga jiangningensis]|uniref:Cytochrome b6-f complex iron-sulfur subunit n=1 Tax=Chitinophaga jiangningensis TaxID=1419482 RepID=A0A1M7MYL7_9BACT|nr:Rieske 2Fe-2S domain-containing protein [Chitinophaga jiangningensis]SHM96197.1 cytochrome b6-f complex iron-sulfur subunit [Chitinophaga jiangningensis]